MNKVNIDKEDLLQLYASSDEAGKAKLESKYGKEIFQPDFREKLAKWESVCELEGIDPVKSLPYPEPKNAEEEFFNATKRIITVIRLLRNGKKPDWTDSSQKKFRPWFDLSSGVGVSCFDYADDRTYTGVGSRFCSLSFDDMKFVVDHYESDYNLVMTE